MLARPWSKLGDIMPSLPPRVVFAVRETDFELLLARHATRQQARFFLETRGQDLNGLETEHQRFNDVLHGVRAQVPSEWRQALVRRGEFDRFLFAPDDLVVAVGQDGLVANVAKYLDGQPVLGINPAPDRFDGVLLPVRAERLGSVLQAVAAQDCEIERRTMAEAQLDTGETLLALNELFIGHRSHQSARYLIDTGSLREQQSSSGLIVATGTGATGWARSIMEATASPLELSPEEEALGFFVREPFPSISTGTTVRSGKLSGGTLALNSRMNDGGVIFADGIEQDFLAFEWGRQLQVGVSRRKLCLVRP